MTRTPLRGAKGKGPMNHFELTGEEYKRYCELIYRVAGIRIADNKRVMVSNRVRRRLRATGIESFAGYYTFLTSPSGGDEMPFFLDEITTNETYFFRDPHHYEWLADTFLPEVAAAAGVRKRRKNLRIWSAACSSGEEPYSIALKLLARKALFAGWPITLLGTDLSGAVLSAAQAGSYDARAVRLVEAADRMAYFDLDKSTHRFVIRRDVKSLVTWKQHNLLRRLDSEPFDCIFLKNVLIYFDTDSKKAVVRHVIDTLAKGGYLVTGPTEGIYSMLDPLKRVKPWLYQRTA
jgi:chemotaxis protein methyltransferase CheR